MCLTIDKYQNSINRLQQDIYPALRQMLNTLVVESERSLADLSDTFSLLQKEFQTLEIFEEQIVFPTIISLFDDSRNEDSVAPDISEIVRLTSIKEENLRQTIAIAQQVELSTLEKSSGRTIANN